MSHVSQLSSNLSSNHNLPEEDDETMSKAEREASVVYKPDSASDLDGWSVLPEPATPAEGSPLSRRRLDRGQEHNRNQTDPQPGPSYYLYQLPQSLPAGYSQPTPFPSQANGAWHHPSFASSWSGYPNSLPSYLNPKDFPSCTGDSCLSGSLSLPGRHSATMSSLEQPRSLCSNPPSANSCHLTLPPYSCSPQGAACCAQCPADAFIGKPVANKPLWPRYHPAYGTCCKSTSVYSLTLKTSTNCVSGGVDYCYTHLVS